jgi:hypothetical protein
MGRFDALTQVEEPKKLITTPLPAVTPPVNIQQSSEVVKRQSNETKKTTKPQNRLSTKQSPTLDAPEKPEKYTTHLEPSLIRKIKLHATEREMKDYQVIQKALLLYFEKWEKNK